MKVRGVAVPPPRELELMWEFRTFGHLPQPGALWDQPAGLLRRMRHVEYVWKVFDGFNHAESMTAWQAKYPEAWSFKFAVEKLRASDHTHA